MRRKLFLFCIVVLSIALLATGCGIPQEDYDAVITERDAAQAEAESLQTQVESLQGELDDAQSQIEDIENDLSEVESDFNVAQSLISSLMDSLSSVSTDLAEAEALIADMEPVYRVVLFFDDFEEGDAEKWGLDGDWTVIQEDSNYVLRGTGPCLADIGLSEWADYTLEARVKFSQSVKVKFRLTVGLGMYYLDILPEGTTLNKDTLANPLLAQSAASIPENQWINLKIEVKGNKIKFYVDDILFLPYTDSSPLLSGAVGFELPENSVVYIDDVIVMVAR